MQNSPIIDFTLNYNKFKKPLFNYVLKIVKSEMFAEDIVHNVFLKYYNNLGKILNTDRTEIWIFTTARNEIFSHYRKYKNKIEENLEKYEDDIHADNFLEDYERQELIGLIEDELGKMDISQSEVYYLKEYSDLSYKEIAEIMDITEDLVRSRIYKVRQKLKTLLTKLDKD
ncbi:MAG: sigma-70 family RNA polymerase sigma factor [Ignavibacteriaceae bacterium]|nr:sigma-70 family RNA polymerase sigma factor [Ignavibacteriaceae bacterium]